MCNLEIPGIGSQVYVHFIGKSKHFLLSNPPVTGPETHSRALPLGFGRVTLLSEARFSLLWHGRGTGGSWRDV